MTEPLLTREEEDAARRFMGEAILEARKAEGRTRPNPCVGVVIVQNGRIVGRGFHERAGAPHAEVMALRDAGSLAKGADLYSTLEPCDHTGRTPPCTRALLQAGIGRVFVGCTDVNPRVSGKGIQRLRGNGVLVYPDILADECRELNAPFFKFVTRHRPFVTLKAAATADGKIATGTGHSQWITCPESRELVHRWRDQVDGVLIGANTLRMDNPRLTARPGGVQLERQPWRVVLSGSMNFPVGSRLFDGVTPDAPVLVVTTHPEAASGSTAAALREKGVRVEVIPPAENGDPAACLDALLRLLADLDVMHLLVEGGASLLGQFIRTGLFDRLRLFIAPKILGSGLSWAGFNGPDTMDLAQLVVGETAQKIGDDFLLTYSRPGPDIRSAG